MMVSLFNFLILYKQSYKKISNYLGTCSSNL